ncbi:ISAzo13-like element transposase-related protein, partial [Parafrankia elaeagni]|uniref:ISAzo13-like element transposase-related protein n=3 Tax=Parafrankia elaeagni TaxID=222534 RepID=UPI000360EC1B
TSKWNKIEHRLFSRITANWRGRPLTTFQTIVSLIANTTTTTGLTVRCELDPGDYPTKVKVTTQDRERIPINRHDFHGDWNYTINQPDD